jgi:hypothetical protein
MLRTIRGIFAIIAIVPVLTFAADSTTFKIQSFIPERFVDTRWTVGGSLYGRGENWHSFDPPGVYTYQDQRSNNDDWRFGLSSDWQHRITTRSRALTLRLAGSTDYTGNHYNNERIDQHYLFSGNTKDSHSTDEFHEGFDPAINALMYLHRDLFLSFTAKSSLDFTQIPNDNSTADQISYRTYYDGSTLLSHSLLRKEGDRIYNRYEYSGELGVGTGRVEVGQYAATALYLLQELRSHNLLVREPNFVEADSLTNLIYQYRLRHAVDRRLLQIETLTTIAHYLSEIGIIANTEPLVQVYLQDVWSYFPLDYRNFGKRIQIGTGISGNQHYSQSSQTEWYSLVNYATIPENPGVVDTITENDLSTTTDNVNDWSVSPYFFVQMEYHCPLSIQLQLTTIARGMNYFLAERQVDWQDTKLRSYYELSWQTRLDDIVNSRTTLGLSWNLNYQSWVQSPSESFQYLARPSANVDIFKYDFGLGVYYRIAIPTMLSVQAQLNGERSNHPDYYADKRRFHNYTLSAAINHYLY